MNLLFVHQNFPGQFKHLAPSFARQGQHRVLALRPGQDVPDWQGVQVAGYSLEGKVPAPHRWLSDLQVKVMRGEAAARRAVTLRDAGFVPDVIVGHPGWGETLFLKDVWPSARLGLYCEFSYALQGRDVGFDPEFPSQLDPLADAARLRLKNANHLLSFEEADAGLSPTAWQRSTYPARMAEKITVVHDGIDTRQLCPNPDVSLLLKDQQTLTRQDEIITFVNRNLEPYRGYHQLARALPELLRRRPQARVMIVGGSELSYGAAPPSGQNWRQIFWDEVKDQVDTSRVHFLGRLPYNVFVSLLQLSSAHIYLTYPFVLSWSLLEAMSIACPIVANRVGPVTEVLTHEQSGLLVDFFDRQALVDEVCHLLDDKPLAARLGANARALVQARFDLQDVCLPAQRAWVEGLLKA